MSDYFDFKKSDKNEITMELSRIAKLSGDTSIGLPIIMPKKTITVVTEILETNERILALSSRKYWERNGRKSSINIVITDKRVVFVNNKGVQIHLSLDEIVSVEAVGKGKLLYESNDEKILISNVPTKGINFILQLFDKANRLSKEGGIVQEAKTDHKVLKKSKKKWVLSAALIVVAIYLLSFVNDNVGEYESSTDGEKVKAVSIPLETKSDNTNASVDIATVQNDDSVKEIDELINEDKDINPYQIVEEEWKSGSFKILSEDVIGGARPFLLVNFETDQGMTFSGRLATAVDLLQDLLKKYPEVAHMDIQNYSIKGDSYDIFDTIILRFAADGKGILDPQTLKPMKRNFQISVGMKNIEDPEDLSKYAAILYQHKNLVKTSDNQTADDTRTISAKDVYLQHQTDIKLLCKYSAESMARFDTRWEDSWTGFPNFIDSVGRSNKKSGSIIVLARNFELQNMFGAWEKSTLKCTFDPENKTLIHTELIVGDQLYESDRILGPLDR